MKRFQRLVCLLSLSFFIASCGSYSLNSLFVSEEDKLRVDVLLDQAIMSLDKGEYRDANNYIQKAALIDPQNEKIAQTKGYVVLGQAGFDVFSITLKLMENQTSKDGENAGFLNILFDVLSINQEEDFAKIGEVDDGSSVSFFNGLKVYKPYKPGSITDTKIRPGAAKCTACNIGKYSL